MTILFTVASLGYGGASKQLAMTANALTDFGHKCIIYTFNAGEKNQELNDKVIYCQENNIIKARWKRWFIIPIRNRRHIKKYHVDIVIGWRTNGGCFAVLSSFGLNVKTIFCERSDPYMEEPGLIHKIVGKIADLSDGGIFQTEKAKLFYKNLKEKSIVIPNAFQSKEFNTPVIPWNERGDSIVYFGRLDIKQKRLDLLIKAFVLISEELPYFHLDIYGSGKDENTIRQLVVDFGLQNKVYFHGAVKDVINKASHSKLFILTSDFEGIPNTVIESMCAGIPIVGTDCSPGGLHVLIENGKNGFICPFRDYKTVAKKSIEILNNEVLAEKFICNSIHRIQEFSPESIFKKWNDYITSL